MIDARFVLVGSILAIAGSAIYVRDTWRGETAPNRVTWTLWGLEPLLAFGVERQEHVGWASVMTLVLGLMPVAVLIASFHDQRSVWRIGAFDIVCGVISVIGLGFWAASDRPTVALVSFVAADAVAALPTMKKSFTHPSSESRWNFAAAAVFAGLTLLTLHRYTTAGGLFPTSVLAMNTVIFLFISTRVGERLNSTTTMAA